MPAFLFYVYDGDFVFQHIGISLLLEPLVIGFAGRGQGH